MDGRGINSDISRVIGLIRLSYLRRNGCPKTPNELHFQVQSCSFHLHSGSRVANTRRICKVMRTTSLSSEAHNGIQRLRGFPGRWFSQLYDKLSESAELRLKGGGPSCELLPSLGVDVFCFIGYPGKRPRSLRATRSALRLQFPETHLFLALS